MDGQQNEAVMHQVQAELANAYAQEFFTVRSYDAPSTRPEMRIPPSFSHSSTIGTPDASLF